MIRDLLNADVDEVLVDDEAQFERITGFLRRTSPEMADRVRHCTDADAAPRRPRGRGHDPLDHGPARAAAVAAATW